MPCPRTQHLSNVPRLRVEKHNISLKILHQAGFETARQATSAERHALTIAPCPSIRGTTNLFEFVERRYFEHFGRASKSDRYAGWLSFRVRKVIAHNYFKMNAKLDRKPM